MRVGIIVFPGSNCDRDMFHVLGDVFSMDPTYVWHEDELPDGLDALVLPGGFSYGDRLRAGAIAARSPVMRGVKEMADGGAPILGVCNGFQILAEAGILPGVLLKNESLGFMCGWTELIVENNATPFTRMFRRGARIPIPIANGEGRYHADGKDLARLERNGQVVFRYAQDVNGSSAGIAGVCNEAGNVVGMMPHPERAAEPDLNPHAARTSLIFESLLQGAGAIH